MKPITEHLNRHLIYLKDKKRIDTWSYSETETELLIHVKKTPGFPIRNAKVIFTHENGTKKYFRIFRDARNFFSEIQGKKCYYNKEIYDFIKYKGSLNGWTAQLNIK